MNVFKNTFIVKLFFENLVKIQQVLALNEFKYVQEYGPMCNLSCWNVGLIQIF